MLFCFTSEFDCRVGHLVLLYSFKTKLELWGWTLGVALFYICSLTVGLDSDVGVKLRCFVLHLSLTVGLDNLVLFCFTSELDVKQSWTPRCPTLQSSSDVKQNNTKCPTTVRVGHLVLQPHI